LLPELEALLELQRCDARLMDAQKRRDEIPKRREALKAALATARTAHEQAKRDLEGARLARRAHEKEIDVIQSESVKLDRQLLDVKTNKEYTAMLHEIEMLKAKRGDRETQVLECFEREEALQALVTKVERDIAEEEKRIRSGEEALDKEIATLDQTIHSIRTDRDQIKPRVPAALLARYDRLARSRDGVAVAEVRKAACGACFTGLTPQAMQEVRRNDAVMTCEQCGRLLIWVEGSTS